MFEKLAFIYLAGFITLFLAGGGAISFDKVAFKGADKKRESGAQGRKAKSEGPNEGLVPRAFQ